MAYNVFPNTTSGEATFYLMFGWDAYMPTLFKLLFQKIRYMGGQKVFNTFGCDEGNLYDDST